MISQEISSEEYFVLFAGYYIVDDLQYVTIVEWVHVQSGLVHIDDKLQSIEAHFLQLLKLWRRSL